MDWCLDLCYFLLGGRGGGGLLFYNFCFCLVEGWRWFSLEFLGDKFYLSFFSTFFLNFLKLFYNLKKFFF